MKTLKIEVPEGHEIDEITFKPIEKKLPTDLSELKAAVYVNVGCGTTEMRNAFYALAQLIRFRDAWNGDWVADWEENEEKYTIESFNELTAGKDWFRSAPINFRTADLRNKFLVQFKDLLETAKPLL